MNTSGNIVIKARCAPKRGMKMRKSVLFARRLLVLALAVALLCGSAMAASYGAKVLVPSMTVYGNSDGNATALGSLKQGTSITVKAVSGDWARISYKGRTLYAKLDDIIFNKHVKAVSNRDTAIKFVTKESYAKNTYYSATLSAGTTVYVVGKNGDQLLVTNASDSALGYVNASALSKN